MGKLLSTGEMLLIGGGLYLLYRGVSVRALGQEIIGIGGDLQGAYFAAPSGPGASYGGGDIKPITNPVTLGGAVYVPPTNAGNALWNYFSPAFSPFLSLWSRTQ